MENKETTTPDYTFELIMGGLIGIILVMVVVQMNFDKYVTQILLTNILICYIIGAVGKDRKIGFFKSYFISLCLSPIIGCIALFASPRLSDEAFKNDVLKALKK